MTNEDSKKPKRLYQPTVEGLEALQMFSGMVPALPGVDVPVEREVLTAEDAPIPAGWTGQASTSAELDAAWDTALGQTFLADLLRPNATEVTDTETIPSGLNQLDRYLDRAWSRAGIAPQKHDDCTQGVYLYLLETLGRPGFDRLVSEVGRLGIREVLSRETNEGPDFFRAIDTVKKRAQRERSFQPLEVTDPPAPGTSDRHDWRNSLSEAIDRALSPREAALIQATLAGETPAEIAEQWGVAPKTVSNEKTRAFQKLRDFLGADVGN